MDIDNIFVDTSNIRAQYVDTGNIQGETMLLLALFIIILIWAALSQSRRLDRVEERPLARPAFELARDVCPP